MPAEDAVFVGLGAWLLVTADDLLLWWEGEHIRIDRIRSIELREEKGVSIPPVYLHPASLAWEQAAQLADEED